MDQTPEQQSIFDGLILSDASLSIRGRGRNARFSMSSKHRSFIEATVLCLPFISWGPINEREIFDKRINKFYHSVKIHSHVSTWLTDQYQRWYPNRKKIVPPDVRIDPHSLLWWYLGDGHLARKKSRPKYRRVILATDSFTDNEKKGLCNKLIELLGGDSIYIEGDRTIVIARKALVKFAQILPGNPVKDYHYKFDFGQYCNYDYFENSYDGRPLQSINEYRRKHKVRELDFEKVKMEMTNEHNK